MARYLVLLHVRVWQKKSLCFFSTLPYIVLKTKQPLTVLTRTFNHHSGNFCHQENFPSNTIQFFKILVGQLFLNKILAFQLPQMHAEKTIQDRNGQAINRRETWLRDETWKGIELYSCDGQLLQFSIFDQQTSCWCTGNPENVSRLLIVFKQRLCHWLELLNPTPILYHMH